jgi:hypothetical protein
LKIVTRGGLEFVNNTTLPIVDVFVIEDGLVIKTLYDKNLLFFEAPTKVGGLMGPGSGINNTAEGGASAHHNRVEAALHSTSLQH